MAAHQVHVRGTCRNGHVVDTVALPGRLTWTGDCPTCGKPVTARRVKGDDPTTSPAADPVVATSNPSVRRVTRYAPADDRGAGRPGAGVPPPSIPATVDPTPRPDGGTAVGGATTPAPASGDPPAGAPPPGTDPPGPGAPARAAGPEPVSLPVEELIPGIYT